MGAVEYAPGEAKGAPDHPHRGFETVTYMMDGELEHRDSNGGGGLITDGATQWMTAGAGIVHSEMPTEQIVAKGGLFHGVQLWVNLPKAEKWSPPQYQDIDANKACPAGLRGRRRSRPPYSRRSGRPQWTGQHPHPDHVRARERESRSTTAGPLAARLQCSGLRARWSRGGWRRSPPHQGGPAGSLGRWRSGHDIR